MEALLEDKDKAFSMILTWILDQLTKVECNSKRHLTVSQKIWIRRDILTREEQQASKELDQQRYHQIILQMEDKFLIIILLFMEKILL